MCMSECASSFHVSFHRRWTSPETGILMFTCPDKQPFFSHVTNHHAASRASAVRDHKDPWPCLKILQLGTRPSCGHSCNLQGFFRRSVLACLCMHCEGGHGLSDRQ